jgi:hypothetical protein
LHPLLHAGLSRRTVNYFPGAARKIHPSTARGTFQSGPLRQSNNLPAAAAARRRNRCTSNASRRANDGHCT